VDPEDRLLLERSAGRFGVELDDLAVGRIERFLGLLDLWNRRLRLTGERSVTQLLRRHVVDSLACVPLLPGEGPIIDVGSGPGFPGAILACVRPALAVGLLDSKERATAFLGEVARRLPLPNVRVLARRGEDAAADPALAGRQRFAVSRGLRPDAFLRIATPLRTPAGMLVSMQTPNVDRSAAEKLAGPHGLRVTDIRDYELPDGSPRRLIVFR